MQDTPLNLMGVVNVCGCVLWVCPVGVAMVPDGNPKKLEPMLGGHCTLVYGDLTSTPLARFCFQVQGKRIQVEVYSEEVSKVDPSVNKIQTRVFNVQTSLVSVVVQP